MNILIILYGNAHFDLKRDSLRVSCLSRRAARERRRGAGGGRRFRWPNAACAQSPRLSARPSAVWATRPAPDRGSSHWRSKSWRQRADAKPEPCGSRAARGSSASARSMRPQRAVPKAEQYSQRFPSELNCGSPRTVQ